MSRMRKSRLPSEVEPTLQKMIAGLRVPETPLDRMWLENAAAILTYIHQQSLIHGAAMVDLVTKLTVDLHGSQRFAWELLKDITLLTETIRHLERSMRKIETMPTTPVPKVVHLFEESTTTIQ